MKTKIIALAESELCDYRGALLKSGIFVCLKQFQAYGGENIGRNYRKCQFYQQRVFDRCLLILGKARCWAQKQLGGEGRFGNGGEHVLASGVANVKSEYTGIPKWFTRYMST